MPSARVRLFVYGSLKRDGRHHDQLSGARFLGVAETEPGYRLEPLGDYLALVRVAGPSTAAPTCSVKGELFEVDEARLPALDDFEGDAYIRCPITLAATPTAEERGKGAFALAYLKKAD